MTWTGLGSEKCAEKLGILFFLPAKNHMLLIKKGKKKGVGFSMDSRDLVFLFFFFFGFGNLVHMRWVASSHHDHKREYTNKSE